MKNNSIILVDYDTQVLNSFLEPLTQENFTVTIVPFNNLPDIPIQPNCVLTTVLLCNKLDDIVRKKVEDLTFYSGMKIALISDIIDHSFISSLKQRDLIDRIDFFKDIFQQAAIALDEKKSLDGSFILLNLPYPSGNMLKNFHSRSSTAPTSSRAKTTRRRGSAKRRPARSSSSPAAAKTARPS